MDVQIYTVLEIADDVTLTAESGAESRTASFSSGQTYTLYELIQYLNTRLGDLILLEVDYSTGEITITAPLGAVDLGWAGSAIGTYLGYDDSSIDENSENTSLPRGWWSGRASRPWGHDTRSEIDDVVHLDGRTYVGGAHTREESAVLLWAHRRSDSGTLAEDLEHLYAVADEWAEHEIVLRSELEGVTDDDHEYRCLLADGYELAPEYVDSETVECELEVVRWLST